MSIIDNYINHVIKNLPPQERQEVKKALYAHIQNMLPDNCTREDEIEVLKKLGDPYVLADQYKTKDRYLIGPKIFNEYNKVLKFATPIIVFFAVFVYILDNVFGKDNLDVINLIIGSLASMLFAALSVFAVLTIAFALFEYYDVKLPHKNKQWTVEDLKDRKNTSKSISKAEGVIAIILNVVFFIIIYFYPQHIGWYYKEDGIFNSIPLFNIDILDNYMPLIALGILFAVLTAVFKIISSHRNIKLAVVNFLNNLYSTIICIVILTNEKVFSTAFFDKFSSSVNISLNTINRAFSIGIKVLVILIIIGFVANSISEFYKSLKYN